MQCCHSRNCSSLAIAMALPWLLERMAQLELLRMYSNPKVVSLSADEADIQLL